MSQNAQVPEPPKSKLPVLALVAVILGVLGLATVQMFGTTVSEKFENANSSIATEVVFGGGGGGGSYDYSGGSYGGSEVSFEAMAAC